MNFQSIDPERMRCTLTHRRGKDFKQLLKHGKTLTFSISVLGNVLMKKLCDVLIESIKRCLVSATFIKVTEKCT